jgi:hypothetical protein
MQRDDIFARSHPFSAPEATDDIPFLIVDNPSKGYYFPIDVDDIQNVLDSYPKEEVDFITHIWLRKHLQKRPKGLLLAEFMTGSGMYLMTLYPLEKSNRHYFGEWEPIRKVLREYERFANLGEDEHGRYAQFTPESAKQYYLEVLLPFCIEGLVSRRFR